MAYDFMSANSYWGIAAETTRGSAASVLTFTPIGSPKIDPKLTWLDDSDFRGSPVMHYDQVPGVRHDEFTGKVFMYSDVYPQLLRGILGGTDTVASVAVGASTHAIGLLNQANTGSQPPSYSIINNSVDTTYQMLGSQLSDLSLAFGATAAVETTMTWMTNPATSVASVSSLVESTQHLVPGWDVAASVGGVAVTVVESGQLDIKRNAAPIHTLGTQAPYVNFAGPLEIAGKLVLVIEAGNAYWANSLIRDQQQIILQFNDPATSNFIRMTMTACQLENPIIDQSKAYISLTCDFIPVANTTDTSNGYSPLTTLTRNGISTSY